MRFSTVLSSALCFSAALGASVTRPLRQHIVKRSSSDICVALDLNLDLDVGHLLHNFGHLDVCICLSTVGLFIEENATVKAAVKKVGVAKVRDHLISQINAHHQKKKCTYPPNGKPSPAPKCSPNSDPCGFTCIDGFTPNLKKRTCDCPSPKVVYNGKCIVKPGKPGHPQPSGKPRSPPAPPRHQPAPPKHQPAPPKHQPAPPQHQAPPHHY